VVFVFGTVCLDRVYRIAKLPTPGGYSAIESEETFLGGEAANTALALKTWGIEVLLSGNGLGGGENGENLLRLLVEKRLPTDRLRLGPGNTPVCHIYVTPDGERTMFGIGFGEEGQELDSGTLALREGHWFTVDPNLGKVARRAAQLASEAGMRVYFMDFIAEDDEFPAGSFWQCSTDWVGFRGNTQKNMTLVQKFVDRHGCFAILSDGPNGLVAGSPEHEVRAYPPYPCPKLVDSTGAGDMFRAGMLYGLDLGWEIADCLKFASAAGCLKCQYLGATTNVPAADEIEHHIRKHKQVSRQYS
jgi:sugar/nucleoside kinase (ribokinase family)